MMGLEGLNFSTKNLTESYEKNYSVKYMFEVSMWKLKAYVDLVRLQNHLMMIIKTTLYDISPQNVLKARRIDSFDQNGGNSIQYLFN